MFTLCIAPKKVSLAKAQTHQLASVRSANVRLIWKPLSLENMPVNVALEAKAGHRQLKAKAKNENMRWVTEKTV